MDKIEKIYVLDCAVMNGNVRMNSNYTGYVSKELAEDAANAVQKSNENNNTSFSVWTKIIEIPIYFKREDVPILNPDDHIDTMNVNLHRL